MDPYRVRTTYERTVAHRTRPPFAYCAEQDGVVESIDDKTKILIIKYKDGNKTAVQFGDQFTNNGGGGFYCTQNIVVNNFKVGDKVKRGDVIVYNEHFFTPDPYNKQVDWNMGAVANVACIETNATLDDGNAISRSLADKLEFNPVHVRDVVLKKTTTVHKYASVGTVVNNTDPLLIFDQSEMTDDMFGRLDDEGIELLSKLNRQTPKAKFTGRVVKIDAFYKCPVDEMADGLKGIVAVVAREKIAKHKAAGDASNSNEYKPYHQIKYTDRIGTTDLDNDTVILRFYIQQDMICACGDKVEFGGPFKSVNSHVEDEDWEVEDGSIKVQAMMSALGFGNRICLSPFLTGTTARVAEQLEKNILKMYFDE